MSDYDLIKDLYDNNKLVDCDAFVQTLKIGDKAPIVMHKKTSQITYVLRGHGAGIVNGKLVKICEGKRLLIKQNQTHSMFAIKEDLLLFHVHIPFFTVEDDRYVIADDINIDRLSNPMQDVVIWDDMSLFGKEDKSIINKLKDINSMCTYHFVSDADFNKWKKNAKGEYIVAIGKRPNLICNANITITPSRIKNDKGICTTILLSEEDKSKINNINKSVDKITIVEDFIVEGKTINKVISEIRKVTDAKIEIIVLGGLIESINSIKEKNDFVKIIVCGPTIDGEPIEDATVLFISDLLSDNRKMLKNRNLMIRCFIDCYDEILNIIK